MILLLALALAGAPATPEPVLVVHDRSVVQGLDPDDGALLWELPYRGRTDDLGVLDGPSVVLGKMRLDAHGMSTVPVDLKLAEVQIGKNASGLYYVSRGDEILWSGSGGTVLGVVEDKVVVLPFGEPYGVEVYDLETGALRWSKAALSADRPMISAGNLLLRDEDHTRHLLSVADGRELLVVGPREQYIKLPVPDLARVASPEGHQIVDLRTGVRFAIDEEGTALARLADGTVWIATRGPRAWWIEAHRDGTLRARWPCPPGNDPAIGVMVGDLLLVRHGAVLLALDPRSGAVRWSRSASDRNKPDAFEAWLLAP